MFFITYLRRELRRRMRQAVFIALGLAVGVGLVVSVAAASTGVSKAEAGVLGSLYGVGTNVTVTGPPVLTGRFGQVKMGGTGSLQPNANGAEACQNGRCAEIPAGQGVQSIGPPYSTFTSADVAAVGRLHDVSAAAGGLLLSDSVLTVPSSPGQAGRSGPLPMPGFFSVDGVDTGQPALGPLSAGTIISGHSLTAANAGSDVAVADSGYAAANRLRAGSALTIDGVRFTVIGIVRQSQGSDDVYIPLEASQALKTGNGDVEAGEVNTIYLTAASATAIPAVQHELSQLLPADTVTTAVSLASEVTASVSGAAKLASDLGRWLAVLVLIAAFAVASLLTMAAVARRAGEFGTLKALGWPTRRIIAQVLGESLAMGIAGAMAGIALGFAGTAIIAAVAPNLSATVPGSHAASSPAAGPGVGTVPGQNPATASHVVAVPLHPSITVGVIALAVILSVAGGLIAGLAASWRIASLRPADALARVA